MSGGVTGRQPAKGPEVKATIVKAGQEVSVTGPDGQSHRGLVLDTYRSTGGIVSVWLDLCGDYCANPANRVAGEWVSQVLVLTQRDGVYRDLWLNLWDVRVLKDGRVVLAEVPGVAREDQ